MGDHHGVVVDVSDARLGRDRLSYLMGGPRARQAGTDVKELPDASLGGQVGDRAAEEIPALARRGPPVRIHAQPLLRRFPVGSEMIFAAEYVILHPRRVRDAYVKAGQRPVRATNLFLPNEWWLPQRLRQRGGRFCANAV